MLGTGRPAPNFSMKKLTSILVLIAAVVVGIFCIFGDDSYNKLASMRRTLESEREQNNQLEASVGELKREVRLLQSDPRAIEKAARNELGMARPSEQIFFFDKIEDGKKRE